MRAVCVALVLLALPACGPRAAPAPAPEPEGLCLTGEIASGGTEGIVAPVLRPEEGGEVWLEGPLQAELLSLTNAEVTVCGREEGDGARLVVSSYELRAVDGMPALLGVLERVGDGYRIVPAGEPPVELMDVSAGLAERLGERVWVAGTWEEGRLRVEAFGEVGSG